MNEEDAKLTLRDGELTTPDQDALEIDAGEFPRLAALLDDPENVELKDELIRLFGRLRRRRAERHPFEHGARLVIPEGDDEIEEPVHVEDISATGVRVSVRRAAGLDLVRLMDVHFLVELVGGGATRVVRLHAWFIRVADIGESSISLAFRFSSITPEEVELLRLAETTVEADDRNTVPPG